MEGSGKHWANKEGVCSVSFPRMWLVQKQMEVPAVWQALRRCVLRWGALPTQPTFFLLAFPVGYCNCLRLRKYKRSGTVVAFSRDLSR